jgi:hypothetical protein
MLSCRGPSIHLHLTVATRAPGFPHGALHPRNGIDNIALDVLYGALSTQKFRVRRLQRRPTEERKQVSVVVVIRFVKVQVDVSVEWIKICSEKLMSCMGPRHAAIKVRTNNIQK